MQPPGGKRSYEEIVVGLLTDLQNGGILTDVNPGSVVRTLVESFAREMAEAYARLGVIYAMGFIDTATGDSLDFLVALLGQERVDGLQVVGEAIFTRDARVTGRVVIPEETELVVQKVAPARTVTYSTMEEAELQAGQSSVTVPIMTRVAPGESPAGVVLSGDDLKDVAQLSSLAGIGAVAVPRPTAPRGYRESDADLRKRVKGLISAAGGGTLKAMERAILATGKASGVVFRDANSSGAPTLQPGELEVVVDGDLTVPGAYEKIRDAIYATKGPGILARLRGITERTLSIQLKVTLSTANLSATRRQTLRRAIEDAVKANVEALSVGQKLLWNPLQAKVLSIDGVLDVADGTTVTLDGIAAAPGREIPAGVLAPLERLVTPAKGPAVTVAFEGEAMIYIRLAGALSAAEAGALNATTRAAMARAVEQKLQAKNEAGGERSLTWEEVVNTAIAAQSASLDKTKFTVQVRHVLSGAENTLTGAGQKLDFGPDEVLYPHPDGPLWGDES